MSSPASSARTPSFLPACGTPPPGTLSITCKAWGARFSRGGSATVWSKWACGRELRLVRIHGISRRRLRAALELPPRQYPEVAAGNRELHLLRRLGLAFLLSDAFRHRERVRRRPDTRARNPRPAKGSSGREHRPRPRRPRLLQVLRFLPV